MKNNSKAIYSVHNGGTLGPVFLLAYIGAAVYFVQQASGFGGIIWALIKAIAWPAILVFQAMHSLGV